MTFTNINTAAKEIQFLNEEIICANDSRPLIIEGKKLTREEGIKLLAKKGSDIISTKHTPSEIFIAFGHKLGEEI